MSFSQYSASFRHKAINAGYSADNIQKCLDYAEPLYNKRLPIIYNTTNLSALVGYNKTYLKKAALYTSYFYRSFEIKKKDGKSLRKITEPLPSLKEIQLWILENILYKLPVSRYAKAYVRKRNIIDNVKYHVGKEKVLNLDIINFFPSIKRTKVEALFRQMGYSSNISNLLSKLCCLEDSLPQGAPTSPYLSNLLMNKIDSVIADFCKSEQIRFTRYADDMTFSGNFDHLKVVEFVKAAIQDDLGLKLNTDKTNIMKQNVRQIVTGVIVNEKLQLTKEQRRKIRLEMYYLKKYGLSSHLLKTNNIRANYIKHIRGRIHYALHLNPNDKELLGYIEFLKKFSDDN